MSASLRLPPGGRDFEVFEAVVVGGQSTREAAARFKLSQTRICQIVERMRLWQAEVVPAESPYAEERLLRVARHVAVQRLDYLYCETLEAWRRSQGEVKKLRSSRYGDDITTTFFSPGDPKYLFAAMRLAKAQAELGSVCSALGAAEGDEGSSYNPEPEATAPQAGRVHEQREMHQGNGRPEARPTDHPVGACSAIDPPAPADATCHSAASHATSIAAESSSKPSPRQAAARRQLLAPVQPPSERAGAVTQLQVTPEQLGVSVTDILSRQERQRRKRARAAG